MTVVIATLFPPTVLPTGVGVIFTAPAMPAGLVVGQGSLRFTNTSAAARAVTAYVVPPGGTPTNPTCFLKAEVIQPNAHLDVDMPVLGPSWTLQGFADAANSVTVFQLDGVIFT